MAEKSPDASAPVGRCVQELGTTAVDVVFDRASEDSLRVATSAWDIGEA